MMKLSRLQISLFLVCLIISDTWCLSTDFLLVTDINKSIIYKARLDDFDLRPLPLINVTGPVAVEYDPIDKMVYWTEYVQPRIVRANLDGTQQRILVNSHLSSPEGLALDPEAKLMFWTDGVPANNIERSSMDGSERRVIVRDDLIHPRAIVADLHGGRIYWTSCKEHARIESSDYNGRDRVVLVEESLLQPNGLALGVRDGCLYWCDAGSKKFEKINLLGNDRETVIDVSMWPSKPFDMALYGSSLLWTDWNTDTVMMLNFTLNLVTNEGPRIFQRTGGLHVYAVQEIRCEDWNNYTAKDFAEVAAAVVVGNNGRKCRIIEGDQVSECRWYVQYDIDGDTHDDWLGLTSDGGPGGSGCCASVEDCRLRDQAGAWLKAQHMGICCGDPINQTDDVKPKLYSSTHTSLGVSTSSEHEVSFDALALIQLLVFVFK